MKAAIIQNQKSISHLTSRIQDLTFDSKKSIQHEENINLDNIERQLKIFSNKISDNSDAHLNDYR